MKNLRLILVAGAFVSVFAMGQEASGQEVISVDIPARTVVRLTSGERIAYLPDGGCTAQPESPVPVPPASVSAAQCNLSRARSRAAVADAIDGGALQ